MLKTPKRFEEVLFELCVRLWSNTPPKNFHGLVGFHGRTKGDAESSLFKFVDLIHRKFLSPVLVNGSGGERQGSNIPGESWPGGKIFKDELMKWGMAENQIILTKRGDNTIEESENMLAHIDSMPCKGDIILISWQHQMLRCFLSMILAMKKSGVFINVYCLCPPQCKWLKDVTGSQGMNLAPRKEHARIELLGIKKMVTKDKNLLQDAIKFLDNQEKGISLETGII